MLTNKIILCCTLFPHQVILWRNIRFFAPVVSSCFSQANPITCTCVSEDKRWLATGDKGRGSMVIVWDTYTG